MITQTIPRMTTKTLGKIRVHSLLDAVSVTRQAQDLLLNVPGGLLDANRDWLAKAYLEPGSDRLVMAYQSFLIEIADTVILIDCAVGEDARAPARPDWHMRKSNWLNHLGRAGYGPEDIDVVFLTHLHLDHTGWLTRFDAGDWVPSFPQARHLVAAPELEFWLSQMDDIPFMKPSIVDRVLPVNDAGLFEFVAPGQELVPGLHVVDLSGHTPGMLGLEFRDGDRVLAAFTADLMHHPLQVADPGLSTVFCMDPARAADVRREKLDQYQRDGTILFCGHFPGESAGHLQRNCGGYRFVPVERQELNPAA